MEAALNFLYGQRPKITIDNAGDIFEMAEFFIIEELKALCIERMRSVPVNMESCLKLLVLMNTYDFNHTKASDFILAHLTELLVMDEMLLLDKDSVSYILSKPMLSYVSREDCFRFLLKWTKHFSLRQLDFPELFPSLKEVSRDIIDAEDLTWLTESNKILCEMCSYASNTSCDALVLFPPDRSSYGKKKFYVYNFELNSWCQSTINDDSLWYASDPAELTTRNTFIRPRDETKLMYYDMANKTRADKQIEVAFCDERAELEHLHNINKKMYCVRSFSFYVEKLRKYISYRQRRQGCSVYFAEDVVKHKITFQPFVSVRGTTKALCVLEEFFCLLMEKRKELLICSLSESVMSSLNLIEYTPDELTNICRCREGGVYVVTKASILQIDIQMKDNEILTNVVDTWIMKSPEVMENFENSKENFESWGCTGNNQNPPRFEIVEDKIFTIARSNRTYETRFYYQMLPKTISLLDKEEITEIVLPDRLKREGDIHVLQMHLPKESLRCHIDCPHCKQVDEDQEVSPGYQGDNYGSDEYDYYDDDSDDDYDDDSDDDYDDDYGQVFTEDPIMIFMTAAKMLMYFNAKWERC